MKVDVKTVSDVLIVLSTYIIVALFLESKIMFENTIGYVVQLSLNLNMTITHDKILSAGST